MKPRIPYSMWPLLAASSPVLVPLLGAKTYQFIKGRHTAESANAGRLLEAKKLELPELDSLELTVVVDYRREPGFLGDAGVSYLVRTELGSVLMDIAFGPATPTLKHNAGRLGLDFSDLDAVLISHLHIDHMGGMAAMRKNAVAFPKGLEPRLGTPCFLPAPCGAGSLAVEAVTAPRLIPAGLASTGPLSRMDCFLGMMDEQAMVARLKGKGLVVITGCGHPTIETILEMTSRISDVPVYAVAGGMHFPVSESRLVSHGVQLQQLLGTGKPWWEPLNDKDIDRTIGALNNRKISRLLLSPHDTCDRALDMFEKGVGAEVEVLSAGKTYVM